MSRLCQARVLTVLGQEACQLQSEDGALLTNYLDPEYRDLLYALVDDKPGARGALADFHTRRADEAELGRASMAAAFSGDPQPGTTVVNGP